MWFRVSLVLLSVALGFLALSGWLATRDSSDPVIIGRYSPGYFTLLLLVTALAVLSLVAQATTIYRKLYEMRWKIILLMSSIVFSLIISEIAIRVFDPLGISYFEESTMYQLDLQPDPVFGFKHTPGLKRSYQGVEVSINELGLRDRKLEKKSEGELRILLLGDSVAFGWGVPAEATFGRKLENILTFRLQRPVKVFNAGVCGYNTTQEYASLKTYADVIEPDVVILLYLSNDTQTNDGPFDPWSARSLKGKSALDAMTILLRRSWLYRLVTLLKYSYATGPAVLDKDARGVKESIHALTSIAALCRERGVGFFTFFYHPRGESRRMASVTNELLSEILSVGYENRFDVCDTGPWWSNVDMRSVTNSVVDPHPNERGHEMLASGMADYLLRHNAIRKTTPDYPSN